MMERHYCAHPSIPGYGPPDAIGIKRWAVLGELVPAWSLGTLGSLWPQAHTHLEDNDDTRKPVSHKTCTNVLSKARPVAEGNRSLSRVVELSRCHLTMHIDRMSKDGYVPVHRSWSAAFFPASTLSRVCTASLLYSSWKPIGIESHHSGGTPA